MGDPFERARAYLAGLEADRQAALTLSEQKAEEARLIKARQEGFQAAMAMLGGEISVADGGAHPKEPGRRRGRRPIRQLILRELSFSGQAMTAAQIARAIATKTDHESADSMTMMRSARRGASSARQCKASPRLQVCCIGGAPNLPQSCKSRAAAEKTIT